VHGRGIARHFEAWNEPDPAERLRLLAECLTDDFELVDPSGRLLGHEGLSARIAQYHADAPNTKVAPGSEVDAHSDLVRYAWQIVDSEGNVLIEGLDVAERAPDGRLRRVLMFHGPLPAVE
jgi:hypothetical protein